MTEREAADRALSGHAAFEADGEEFAVTATTFEARVAVEGTTAGPVYAVTVRVPTIDSVVAGETVAPVVQEGWLETFELRVADVGGVTRLEPTAPEVSTDAAAEEVVVETSIPADRPNVAADDAKAVVDFVEGTFVEGIIPGYTYREPVSGLIERARSAGEV